MTDQAVRAVGRGGLMATAAPKNKVVAASAGAAVGSSVAVILVWVLRSTSNKFSIPLPDDVASALAVLCTTLLTMGAGYYTPPGANEGVVIATDGSARSAVSS